jgi:hypothetical protein
VERTARGDGAGSRSKETSVGLAGLRVRAVGKGVATAQYSLALIRSGEAYSGDTKALPFSLPTGSSERIFAAVSDHVRIQCRTTRASETPKSNGSSAASIAGVNRPAPVPLPRPPPQTRVPGGDSPTLHVATRREECEQGHTSHDNDRAVRSLLQVPHSPTARDSCCSRRRVPAA